MSVVIDPRLNGYIGEPSIAENFNRLLALTDGLDERVDVLEGHVYNASLKAMTIGSPALTLTPTFAEGTLVYTASTSSASDVISATAKRSSATIVIKNGDSVVTNGSAATWAEGANVVKITVTHGDQTKEYQVTVTYTPDAGG